MHGIGLPAAANIFVKAHSSYLLTGDYNNLRDAMVTGAMAEHGVLSIEHKAVQNAYAAISVGTAANNVASGPPITPEIEPNSNWAQAQGLGMGSPPPPKAVLPAPNKIKVVGGGNDLDGYSVRLVGKKIAVLITPTCFSSACLKPYALYIVDSTGVLANAPESADPQLLVVEFATSAARDLRIAVLSSTATPVSAYQLDIDLDQNTP